MLCQLSRGRCARWRRADHVVACLSGVRGVQGMLSVDGVTWRCVRVVDSLWRAVESMALRVRRHVVARWCVDRLVEEARVSSAVWVTRVSSWRCRRVHRNGVHGSHGARVCVWRGWTHGVSSSGVRRARHWPTSDCGRGLGLGDCRLRVHVLRRPDVSQLRVVGRLRKVVGVGARVVADEVEVLAAGGCDAERLLHKTVRFVAVPIWAFTIRIACRRTLGRLAARPLDERWCRCGASSLALHLSICQEAAGYSARAP
jgi:hypothetical protein